MNKYRIKVKLGEGRLLFKNYYRQPLYTVQKRFLLLFYYDITCQLDKNEALFILNELNSFA